MAQTCIIIGAGHATAQLVPSLRSNGWTGRIIVIGAEDSLPYHRPPLSKDYLLGSRSAAELLIRQASVYERAEAEFRLGQRVTAIDRTAQQISMGSGEKLSYDKLVLATGSQLRRLSCPGADQCKVHYLRTLEDADAIRADIRPGATAAVIGGGFIGLEMAAALQQQGMHVHLFEAGERLLGRVTAPVVADFWARKHQGQGVELHLQQLITRLESAENKTLVYDQSGTVLAADLVVAGIGVQSEAGLAEAAGLQCNNGIHVDAFARSSDPDILAIGDCAAIDWPDLEGPIRLESVPHATAHAKTAAATLCGQEQPYRALPWFWSDQYEVKWQIAGLSLGYDQIMLRGNPEQDSSFVVWYRKAGQLIAADCINSPREFMLARKWIETEKSVPDAVLTDTSLSLMAWHKSQT